MGQRAIVAMYGERLAAAGSGAAIREGLGKALALRVKTRLQRTNAARRSEGEGDVQRALRLDVTRVVSWDHGKQAGA